jgi:hypothetical protein
VNCPECGARDNLCQTRFDEFLALEFSDLHYGTVHNLTVATFILQHSSRMSREGWLYERELLRDFIVNNKSPDLVRQQTSAQLDCGKRTFRFQSKDGKPVISKITWGKTILDVRAENPEMYCEDVTAWARSALEEVEAIQ